MKVEEIVSTLLGVVGVVLGIVVGKASVGLIGILGVGVGVVLVITRREIEEREVEIVQLWCKVEEQTEDIKEKTRMLEEQERMIRNQGEVIRRILIEEGEEKE